jgi:hypothetical protein
MAGKSDGWDVREVDAILERTVKRIERLNRVLTVAVVVEALALVIFL